MKSVLGAGFGAVGLMLVLVSGCAVESPLGDVGAAYVAAKPAADGPNVRVSARARYAGHAGAAYRVVHVTFEHLDEQGATLDKAQVAFAQCSDTTCLVATEGRSAVVWRWIGSQDGEISIAELVGDAARYTGNNGEAVAAFLNGLLSAAHEVAITKNVLTDQVWPLNVRLATGGFLTDRMTDAVFAWLTDRDERKPITMAKLLGGAALALVSEANDANEGEAFVGFALRGLVTLDKDAMCGDSSTSAKRFCEPLRANQTSCEGAARDALAIACLSEDRLAEFEGVTVPANANNVPTRRTDAVENQGSDLESPHCSLGSGVAKHNCDSAVLDWLIKTGQNLTDAHVRACDAARRQFFARCVSQKTSSAPACSRGHKGCGEAVGYNQALGYLPDEHPNTFKPLITSICGAAYGACTKRLNEGED